MAQTTIQHVHERGIVPLCSTQQVYVTAQNWHPATPNGLPPRTAELSRTSSPQLSPGLRSIKCALPPSRKHACVTYGMCMPRPRHPHHPLPLPVAGILNAAGRPRQHGRNRLRPCATQLRWNAPDPGADTPMSLRMSRPNRCTADLTAPPGIQPSRHSAWRYLLLQLLGVAVRMDA